MGEYKYLVIDYPARCQQLVETFWDEACKLGDTGHEVTLLLAMCGAAIGTPLERLELLSSKKHISADAKHKELAELRSKLKELLKKPFATSELSTGVNDAWKYFEKVRTKNDRDWNSDPSAAQLIDDARPSDMGPSCENVLFALRHALAHGNVFVADASHNGSVIKTLAFINNHKSKTKETWKKRDVCLLVTPLDLRQFLTNWTSYLASDGLIHKLLSQSLERVA